MFFEISSFRHKKIVSRIRRERSISAGTLDPRFTTDGEKAGAIETFTVVGRKQLYVVRRYLLKSHLWAPVQAQREFKDCRCRKNEKCETVRVRL